MTEHTVNTEITSSSSSWSWSTVSSASTMEETNPLAIQTKKRGWTWDLRVLLWKSLVMRRRMPIALAIEIFIPLLLVIVLVGVRTRGFITAHPECHVEPLRMPGNGMLSYAQSVFCNMNYTCVEYERNTPMPFTKDSGTARNFPQYVEDGKVVFEFLREVQQVAAALSGQRQLTVGQKFAADIPGFRNSLRIKFTDGAFNHLLSTTPTPFQPTFIVDQFRQTTQSACENNVKTYYRQTTVSSSLPTFEREFCQANALGRVDLITKTHTSLTALTNLKLPDINALLAVISRYQNSNQSVNFDPSAFAPLANLNLDSSPNQLSKVLIQMSEPLCGTPADQNDLGRLGMLIQVLQNREAAVTRSDSIFNLRESAKNHSTTPQAVNYEFCSTLKQILYATEFRFLTGRLRSFLYGSVYFYPVTDFTLKLMQETAKPFEKLRDLVDLLQSFEGGPAKRIEENIRTGPTFQTMRLLLQLCQSDSSQSAATQANCKQAADFLAPTKPEASTAPHWSDYVEQAKQIFSMLATIVRCVETTNRFVGFNTLDDLLFSLNANNGLTDIIALEFTSIPKVVSTKPLVVEGSPILGITFRAARTRVDTTYDFKAYDITWYPEMRRMPQNSMKYFTSGVIDLQDMLERSLVAIFAGKDSDAERSATEILNDLLLPAELKLMPAGCYKDDDILGLFGDLIPLIMILAWITTVIIMVKSIVMDKESRVKEFTKVMGMTNALHWANWTIVNGFIMFTSAVIMSLLLTYGRVFMRSEPSFILFFICSYVAAIMSTSFFLSTLFSSANVAAVVAALAYLLAYLPYLLTRQLADTLSPFFFYLAWIFPQVPFSYGWKAILRLEGQGLGANWVSTSENILEFLPYNLTHICYAFWLNTLLFALLTWYVEAVFPGRFGVPQPYYFMFTKQYWRPNASVKKEARSVQRFEQERQQSAEASREVDGEERWFETPPADLKCGIETIDLCKVYPSTLNMVVDHLNVKFYRNQVTSFLGHNGAGKTTTMSMLTGLLPPSSGTALVNGFDIRREMVNIRRSLGFCPQHNILMPNLSVAEHIRFFAMLKGLSFSMAKKIVPQLVKDLGFAHKTNDIAKNLSGGQKRKLCILLAFLGNSSVVMLDEPTAGVDPYSRRSIWDLIIKYKRDRTVILTTHHMDEADVLGDRIVILSQGKLQTIGTTMFLKEKYGSGYRLQLSKMSDFQNLSEAEASGMATDVLSLIWPHIPAAELIDNTNSQLTIRLPTATATDGSLVSLLKAFEGEQRAELTNLGIQDFGLSDSSLEDVFLRVAKDPSRFKASRTEVKAPLHQRFMRYLANKVTGKLSKVSQSQEATTSSSETSLYFERQSLAPHLWSQFWGMMCKRFHNIKRNKRSWLVEMLLPLLLVLLLVPISKIRGTNIIQPLMQLSPWFMAVPLETPTLQVFFSDSLYEVGVAKPSINENQTESALPNAMQQGRAYSKWMGSDFGFSGTRCFQSQWGQPFQPSELDFCFSESSAFEAGLSVPGAPSERLSELRESSKQKCDCSKTGFQVCDDVYVPKTARRMLRSTDQLLDLTGFNLSNYLVKTVSEHRRRLYGGVEFKTVPDPMTLAKFSSAVTRNNGLYDLLGFLSTKTPSDVTIAVDDYWVKVGKTFGYMLPTPFYLAVHFDNRGYVSSTGYLNLVHNMQLRNMAAIGTMSNPDYVAQLGVVNYLQPWPPELRATGLSSIIFNLSVSIFLILAMSFIPASFVQLLITERQSGAKQLQLVSGLNRYIYWLSTFVWDVFNYCVPALAVVCIFAAFNQTTYISPEHLPAFVTLILLYGPAVAPMLYPTSFVIKTPSTAFVALSTFNLTVGAVATITTFIIDRLAAQDQELQTVNDFLKKFFLIFPQYCLGKGVFVLAQRKIEQDNGLAVKPVFSDDGVGLFVKAMVIQAFVYLILVMLIQQAFFVPKLFDVMRRRVAMVDRWVNKRTERTTESAVCAKLDEDVAQERERVLSAENNDPVQAINLIKAYGTFKKSVAVRGVSFGVRTGECFGLLGVNGAGKTSTFRMLTGSASMTVGRAAVNGHCVTMDRANAHKSLGFCPQFDAILDTLTGEETLYMFGRLRGIPRKDLKRVVDCLLDRSSLRPHAKKVVGAYSGGNRRKLSAAVALIGDPKVVFLDEPTSGMDPGAKRFLWEQIRSLLRENRSVVLTSHSMEECEALCDRIGIMVAGQFRCLGTVQHLKQRFGSGYTVDVRVHARLESAPKRAEDLVVAAFSRGDCELKEQHNLCQQYHIKSRVPVSQIFEQFSALCSESVIGSFSVFQTTLDQVFVDFAKLEESACQDDDSERSASRADTLDLDSLRVSPL